MPGLQAYWRFSPSGGSTTPDSSGHGYTGTLAGGAQIGAAGSGPTLTGDPSNSAVELSGASQYVTTTLTSTASNMTTQGTILAWVYLNQLPSSTSSIFEIASQSQGGDDFDFQIQQDNKVYFYTDGNPLALRSAASHCRRANGICSRERS